MRNVITRAALGALLLAGLPGLSHAGEAQKDTGWPMYSTHFTFRNGMMKKKTSTYCVSK